MGHIKPKNNNNALLPNPHSLIPCGEAALVNVKMDLSSLLPEELRLWSQEQGFPAYRGDQIFHWLHQRGVADFSEMTNLPQDFRRFLQENASLKYPKILKRQEAAANDTVKLLLELDDGEQVEMVLMLYARQQSKNRATCCVSSQTGCPIGCAFCATAWAGPGRNLLPGEMTAQVILAGQEAKKLGFEQITNVVYMGMGEPLLNLAALRQSIAILNHPQGLNIGMRKITISTCGLTPQIYQIADWGWPLGLALSLHAADEGLRKSLIPAAKTNSLQSLLAACSSYREKTGQRVTYEYALFAGINDSIKAAHALGRLLAGHDALLNIIPANSVKKTGFFAPKGEIIKVFIEILSGYNLEVQLREPRGQDIDAACGQLRIRN